MDENAKMKELLTITQLDQLKRQIKGVDQIDKFEEISLLPIKETSVEYKNKLKGKIEAFVQNFNSRDWNSLKEQFTDNVKININGTKYTGVDALVGKFNKRIAILPDVTYHLDRNVVEGDRGALAYTVNGTFKTKAVMSREGVHFQFNNKGKITEIVIVYNGDDLANQMN